MVRKKTYHVLIVEDDKFYQELFKNYFSGKNNFNISCFSSGEDCLTKTFADPDLIILDYILDRENPDAMDGRGVFKVLKEKCPTADIIIISAQQSADVVFSFVRDGVRNYIMKDNQTFNELDRILKHYNE